MVINKSIDFDELHSSLSIMDDPNVHYLKNILGEFSKCYTMEDIYISAIKTISKHNARYDTLICTKTEITYASNLGIILDICITKTGYNMELTIPEELLTKNDKKKGNIEHYE